MHFSEKISIGLIQTYCETDGSENIKRHKALIRQAAEKGAQIVCLQELFHTLYFCASYDENFFELAESVQSDMIAGFGGLAAELEVVLILPFFERRAKGIYHNSLTVIDADGRNLGLYRKMHIPDDPGFYEKYYFTPGDNDTGYRIFDTRFGKIGALICWDQWYPEAARVTALKGADILFYPTAIGTLPTEGKEQQSKYHNAWETIQRSHAIANGCFVASVNRVGQEKEATFWGGSFVAGPFGEILAKAGNEEEILVQEVDLSAIEKQRQTWPFLRDRRIDSYSSILKRYDDEE